MNGAKQVWRSGRLGAPLAERGEWRVKKPTGTAWRHALCGGDPSAAFGCAQESAKGNIREMVE